MTTFEIQYATTAEQSLYSPISHLEPYIGFDGAEKKLSSLITSAEAYAVGKVYDMHTDRRNDGFYVMTDINTRHYFDSLDSSADESGFKSSDHWELVE